MSNCASYDTIQRTAEQIARSQQDQAQLRADADARAKGYANHAAMINAQRAEEERAQRDAQTFTEIAAKADDARGDIPVTERAKAPEAIKG